MRFLPLVLLSILSVPASAQRGGWDPGSFLDRLDQNNNGTLEPDEQVGPANFLIPRLNSFDPSIEKGKPIPLDKLKSAFAKMRGQRDRDGDRGGRRGRGPDDDDRRGRRRDRDGRGGDDWRKQDTADLAAEPLVPGFGDELYVPELVMGFGATAEIMATTYNETDMKEAKDRLNQFDKNKDGYIAKDEIAPIFTGNPMDYDRNRDGRLSAVELAIRQARRREAKADREASKVDDDETVYQQIADEDPFGGRRSYRRIDRASWPEGSPGLITDADGNGDGRVSLKEFIGDEEWSDDRVNQFEDHDLNGDGVITGYEAVTVVSKGTRSAQQSKFAAGPSGATTRSAAPAADLGPIEAKYRKWAARLISRYDRDQDGELVAGEWKAMPMNPGSADANRDGRITADEYAAYMQGRDRR